MLIGWSRYAAGEVVDDGTDFADALAACSKDGFVWFQMADPDDDELKRLGALFDLPEPFVKDAGNAHQRPSLENDIDEIELEVFDPEAHPPTNARRSPAGEPGLDLPAGEPGPAQDLRLRGSGPGAGHPGGHLGDELTGGCTAAAGCEG